MIAGLRSIVLRSREIVFVVSILAPHVGVYGLEPPGRDASYENPGAEIELTRLEEETIAGVSQRTDPTADATRLETVSLEGVSARGAALLLSGLSGGEVRGAVTWTLTESPSDSADAAMLFVVEVVGRSLLAGSASGRIPIELYGYLVDDAGAVVGHLSEGVVLEHAAQTDAVARGGMKFIGTIETPPGLHSFRVVVRNRQTGEFFLSRQDLQVPKPDVFEPFLLPPLVADPTSSWVVALQHGLDAPSIDQLFPGVSPWPSARPVWDSTTPLAMVVGCPELAKGLSASARLLDEWGRTVGEPGLSLDERVLSIGLVEYYHLTVSPPDVPAGEYRLVLELTDTDSGESAARSMTLDVHHDDTRRSWAELGGQGLEPPTTPRTTVEVVGKNDVSKGEMVESYSRALDRLAKGDEVAARRLLADIEARVIATQSPKRIKQLRSAEIGNAVHLAESDPNTVLAVALFHRDMYRWYAARRRTVLASHSWQVATAIMDQAARAQEGLPVAGFREAVMLDQASDLAREGDMAGARRLLEHLVGIAPDNPQARLGLATLCERTGDPAGAVENLQALLENRPDHAEARLRLAINQTRVGADRKAERQLHRLLAQQTPLWIRTLAYQELGRSLVERGKVNEGEQLLRAAVNEVPRNQRLQILHAHALDVQQRPWQAAEVVEALESRGGQQSTSPRLMYAQWPDLDLERLRAVLSQARELGVRALRGVFE